MEKTVKRALEDFPKWIQELETAYGVKIVVETKEVNDYWVTLKLTARQVGSNIHALVNDFPKVLDKIASTYKYEIEIATESFKPNSAVTGFTSIVTIHYHDHPMEQVEFARHAAKFGFELDDFHMTFWVGGARYQLLHFRPRAKKEPCVALSLDDFGYKYVFSVDVVKGKAPHNGPLKEYE